MRKILIFCLLAIVLTRCQNEEEFDTELIPGEYTGNAFYSSSSESGGVPLISNDPTKGRVFKTMVQKVGSNFVLSFDQSFNYTIPDITVEITSVKNTNSVAITTLPGQKFSSVTRENTYRNQPSNYFSHDDFIRRMNLELTLKSNDADSTSAITIMLFKLYNLYKF